MTDRLSNNPGSGAQAAPGDALLSRSEIVALCTKAARGAGMAWGLAEEAGFATGWLAVRGIDGPRALVDHLAWAVDKQWQEICPSVAPGIWTAAEGGVMCPIALGATLYDFCALPDSALDDEGLSIGPISHPVLLLPFLASMAQRLGHAISLSWAGGKLTLTPSEGMAGAAPEVGALTLVQIIPERDASMMELQPVFIRQGYSRDVIERLETLALKTTVPRSETSRADAGAAGSDND